MSGEQVKALLRKQARQRELVTLGGFVALVAGLWLGWGLAVALVSGGGMVFAAGMYGILRK